MEQVERPDAGAPPRRPATFSVLARNRDFRLLFCAMVVSFAGDWFLFVALAGLVFELTRSPAMVALLYASTTVPFALGTFVGGPLADRLNRQLLMISADVVRGGLAVGFFLVHSPSQVWVVFALQAAISALGALFEPTSQAAVPNLVDPEDLAAANVLAGATWGTMLAVGSAIGGLVVVAFGRGAGYLGDSLSFFLSAALVGSIRRPFSERRGRAERTGLLSATRETVRYARQDRRVLALLTVKAGFGLGGGVVSLLPVLALQVFASKDAGTGLLFAFRGVGVFVGPFLIRRLIRDDDLSTVFWAVAGAFATYGIFYAVVPWAPALLLAGLLVGAAHLGGGSQWTLSTYALQRIVPDHIRGRVFAFDYGLVTFTLALSASLAGWAADAFGVRLVMTILAAVTLTYTVVWTVATAGVRRELRRGRARPAVA